MVGFGEVLQHTPREVTAEPPSVSTFPPRVVVVEAVFTPVTYVVVARLKKAEGVDYFDYKTNFNPFIIKPQF